MKIIQRRQYFNGQLLYFHWYDAYSYTDWERDAVVFMPIPLNVIVAVARRMKTWMFDMLLAMDTREAEYQYEKARQVKMAFDQGFAKGRDFEFRTMQDHAEGMRKLRGG